MEEGPVRTIFYLLISGTRGVRVCELNSFVQILPPRGEVSIYFTFPLELLDMFELQKLEVAHTVIASEQSALHRYCQNVVAGRSNFRYYSPTNRNTDPLTIINFVVSDPLFGFELVEQERMAFLTVNGRRWHSVWEIRFPQRVRVVVTNPALLNAAQWKFLDMAVDDAGWQVLFKELNYISKSIYRDERYC